jgi:hypothetical protein
MTAEDTVPVKISAIHVEGGDDWLNISLPRGSISQDCEFVLYCRGDNLVATYRSRRRRRKKG